MFPPPTNHPPTSQHITNNMKVRIADQQSLAFLWLVPLSVTAFLAGLKDGNDFDFLLKIILKAEQSEMKSRGTVEQAAETAQSSNGLILFLEILS